jgi:hypothetical protein
MDITYAVTIAVGRLAFRAWRPELSSHMEIRFRERARKFCEEQMEAVPTYLPSLKSPYSANATSNLRYGKNNTVYIQRRAVETKGGRASVLQVEEANSGSIFAAKELFFHCNDGAGKRQERWERLKSEYEITVELKHASHPRQVVLRCSR